MEKKKQKSILNWLFHVTNMNVEASRNLITFFLSFAVGRGFETQCLLRLSINIKFTSNLKRKLVDFYFLETFWRLAKVGKKIVSVNLQLFSFFYLWSSENKKINFIYDILIIFPGSSTNCLKIAYHTKKTLHALQFNVPDDLIWHLSR